MNTSSGNPVSPSTRITPDLVSQKSAEYGIVAEMKRSLEMDRSRWDEHVKQVLKYDDDLSGWWTKDGAINHSDAVLLIHQSRSRAFVDHLEKSEVVHQDTQACLCVIEFNQSTESKVFYHFRREYGHLRDQELDSELWEGKPVPLDEVVRSFPTIHYYDAPPPLMLLLQDLWISVFPSLREEGSFDEQEKSIKITVSLKETVREMQRAYGSARPFLVKDDRSVEFPKHKWVREAFDWFVSHKLASKSKEDADKYEIHYKSFREDVLDHFAKIDKTRKQPEARSEQLELFPLDEGEDE